MAFAIFLVLHVAAMFLAMMIAVRAALAAVFRLREVRTLAWVALGGLVVGGLVLGPIVQKYAFGAFWTGWPNGYDLTVSASSWGRFRVQRVTEVAGSRATASRPEAWTVAEPVIGT